MCALQVDDLVRAVKVRVITKLTDAHCAIERGHSPIIKYTPVVLRCLLAVNDDVSSPIVFMFFQPRQCRAVCCLISCQWLSRSSRVAHCSRNRSAKGVVKHKTTLLLLLPLLPPQQCPFIRYGRRVPQAFAGHRLFGKNLQTPAAAGYIAPYVRKSTTPAYNTRVIDILCPVRNISQCWRFNRPFGLYRSTVPQAHRPFNIIVRYRGRAACAARALGGSLNNKSSKVELVIVQL